MAIARPVTKTKIDTAQWGIPITDAVNANAAALAALTPTPWTNVTFQNGWANYNNGFQTVQYRKVGDVVTVRGLMNGATVPSVAFQLPVGFRPVLALQFPTSATGNFAWFQIGGSTDGTVTPNAGTPTAYNVNCSFSTT